MTYPKAFKTYITKLAHACRDITGHNEYSLKLVWSEVKDASDEEGVSSTRLSVNMDTVYLWAAITVYPRVLADYNEGDFPNIGQDMLHELCHLFIDPVEKLVSEAAPYYKLLHIHNTVERQTERITKRIVRNLGANWSSPKALGCAQ